MKLPHKKAFEYWYFGIGCVFALAASVATSIYLISLMIWCSASFFLVSLAYFTEKPTIFRKTKNGHLPVYVRIILWPFLLSATLYNGIERRRDPTAPIHEIIPGLYLARRLLPADAVLLKQLKIDAVVDATAEFNALEWTVTDRQIGYLNVPVLDHQSPRLRDVVKAINWIHKHRNDNKSVVVHCALGRGRSVLLVAAYLLALDKDNGVRDVLSQIQTKRHTANLNFQQLRFLEQISRDEELKLLPLATIIANPVAGGGKWTEHKHEICDQLGLYYSLNVLTTTPETDAKSLTRKALDKNPELVIACGGDGTVNEVVTQLSGAEVPLAIVPLGTTNALSHALWGVKAKIAPVDTACEVIIGGCMREIDIAKCNDELFTLVAAIGFESRMIELADRDSKNSLGQLAYISGFFKALIENTEHVLQVRYDDSDWRTIKAKSLVIANAAPMFTLLAQGGGEPDIDDGQLDVTLLDSSVESKGNISNMIDLLLANVKEPDNDSIIHQKCRSIDIKSDESLTYVIDGEVREAEQISIKIIPQQVSVMIPAKE